MTWDAAMRHAGALLVCACMFLAAPAVVLACPKLAPVDQAGRLKPGASRMVAAAAPAAPAGKAAKTGLRPSAAEEKISVHGEGLAIMNALEASRRTPQQKADLLLRRADIMAQKGDAVKAIAETREALREAPSYAPAYAELGYLLIRKGDLDNAMKAFEDALRINPYLHTAKTGKGMVLLKKGDLAGAVSALKSALVLNPDPLLTYYELGRAYQKMGKGKEAVDAYKEGLKIYEQNH